MSVMLNRNSKVGAVLANRLGLRMNKREGHDLAGPCIACKSSDAFRLHQQTGVAYCHSCGGKWSPFQVAEAVLRDRERAKALLIELGVFQPAVNNGDQRATARTILPDPIGTIAKQKGVTPASLQAYGAKAITPNTVRLPAYGPDGKQCTHFDLPVHGSKGKFAYRKPAGLFFPHQDGKVRSPQPGETWHLVEGPKDAAALHGLGLLASGLNTSRLAPKFARLFTGVNVILIPDRDLAGEKGVQRSARALRGKASSVRQAVLPAEFKESDGEDVRDVLRRPGGRELVMQAIAEAQAIDSGNESLGDGEEGDASAEIKMPKGDSLTLTVSPTFGKPQRLVVARRGEVSHRDRINADSSVSRDRFVKRLAGKLGIEAEVLGTLVDPQITTLADQVDEQSRDSAGGDGDDMPSQATLAVSMAADWELWHSPNGDAYATIPVGDHQENWPVKSQTFKHFVSKRFYEEQGKVVASDVLSATINLFIGKAQFDGEEHPIHVRLGEHEGRIYVDRCNPTWQVIEISPQGWQVIDESPIKFRRSSGMLPLPMPERGGSVDELRDFLNIDGSSWFLVAAWLVAALRPRGPYPVLALFAEQGCGKSVTGRLLRDLVDPNSAPLRSEPRDAHNLMITASNSWCMAYDNLSHVSSWLSDAFCRLSTGGGFATRELYTDQDEIIFDSQRPLLLTSIEEVATRSDLLDRCLIVWLPPIPENRRRPEAELMQEFEKARPRILGALLDAVVGALRDLPSTKVDGLPRMADFALWATAAEAALGWPRGTFMAAYKGNRASANEVALEASTVARPLLDLLEEQGQWTGTSGELLEALESRVSDQIKRQRIWPKNPRSMSGHLKRLAPNLRAAGWQVEFHRDGSRRLWSIQRQTGFASSDAFASHLRHTEMGANQCKTVQKDVNRPAHDANDANDANAGTPSAASSDNGRGWEEGDL